MGKPQAREVLGFLRPAVSATPSTEGGDESDDRDSPRGICGGSPNETQTPRKQGSFQKYGMGIPRGRLTQNFFYSTRTFLSDAPLAQLDRALDYVRSLSYA